MRRLHTICLASAAILCLGGPARGDDPKPPPAPVPPAGAALPDPAPYLDVKGCSLVGVSRDGKVVAFLKRDEDTVQLWRTDADGKATVRVTQRKDAVDFAALSPDGSTAVVGYDRDGDENAGLFFVNVTGDAVGKERELSAVPGVQHGDVNWSKEGDKIFFRSNADSKADFHLYEMTVADGKARRILAEKGSWSVEDVAPGGAKVLVQHSFSNYDASIYVLDTTTGVLTEIDPKPAGKTVALGDAHFLGGGRSVIYTTDADSDFRTARVALLDAGKVLRIETGDAADVEATHVVLDESVGYLLENLRGLTRVVPISLGRGGIIGRMPPPRDLRYDSLDQTGVWGKIESDAGGRLYYSFSAPMEPTSVRRWDPATGGFGPIVSYDLGGLPKDAMPEPPKLVEITAADGTKIPAWRHLPQPGTRKGLPFLIHVHGGPEGQARPLFNGETAYFLSLGFGALEPNVRGSTGYGKAYRDADNYKGRMDSVRDVKACAEWLVKEGWADPKRIAIMGGSYGGYMVLACLTEFPETFAAGVEAVGIANFETFLERTAPYRRALREAEYGPLTDREFLKSISPIHKVEKIVAPLLIAHGEQDPRVPVGEARQMEAALKALGRPVEAIYFPDEGHGWQKKSNRLIYLKRVAEFLTKHLKPGS